MPLVGMTVFAVGLLFALGFLIKWTSRRHPLKRDRNSDSARPQSSAAEPPCLPRASQ
jgi:hypothetical protein